jgi:multidrug efflux pump subunit AcrA (membrane-fusion protein)
MKNNLLWALVLGLAVVAAGCDKKEAEKKPERVVNVTTTAVARKDLPVAESAVGSATSLSAAQALDPTQLQRGSFTIRLPFPEHVARQLRVGQAVKLTSFDNPDRAATATVREIRPALDNTTQTMEVIAVLAGGREWYSVGSVRGEVVIGVRRGALVVPEQAVVLRPAGTHGTKSAVYAADGEFARERTVKTGVLRNGEIEVTEGLKAGEVVVVDGAGLLSDGAKIRVMEPAPAGQDGKPKP